MDSFLRVALHAHPLSPDPLKQFDFFYDINGDHVLYNTWYHTQDCQSKCLVHKQALEFAWVNWLQNLFLNDLTWVK